MIAKKPLNVLLLLLLSFETKAFVLGWVNQDMMIILRQGYFDCHDLLYYDNRIDLLVIQLMAISQHIRFLQSATTCCSHEPNSHLHV